MEQRTRSNRSKVYFFTIIFAFSILLSLYFIFSNRFRPKTDRALYIVVDKAYRGEITIHHTCGGGEKLDFFNAVTTFELKQNEVSFQNELANSQVGILNKGDLYNKDGTMKYLLDKNPRVISVERTRDQSGDCKGVIKIVVDTAR